MGGHCAAGLSRVWSSLGSFHGASGYNAKIRLAAALKCGARDRWVGWDFRHQYDRLNLIANNSRFLILPRHHHQNLASKVLSLCQRRIQTDWVERFGFPLLLLETFVDATRFVGTIYQAANWHYVGETRGYQRLRGGYSRTRQASKRVFVQPLRRHARALLTPDCTNVTEQEPRE